MMRGSLTRNEGVAKLLDTLGAETMRVAYEDMNNRWEDTLAGVFDFVGASNEDTPKRLERQKTMSSLDYVENREELEKYLARERNDGKLPMSPDWDMNFDQTLKFN